MLGKLLKYDFRSIGRILFPVYGAMLVAAILLGLSSRNTNVSLTIAIIYSVLLIAAMVMTVVLVIQRFYQNLLGSQGYLMFTIPVSTGTHIFAKVLTALIWGLIGVLVVVLSGVLIVVFDPSLGGFQGIGEMMNAMFQVHLNPEDQKTLLFSIVLGILTVTALVTRIYASISVGHLWSGHRLLGAFLAYIGFQILVFWLISGIGLSVVPDLILNEQAMLAELLVPLLQIVFYGAITWLILDRRLNLE